MELKSGKGKRAVGGGVSVAVRYKAGEGLFLSPSLSRPGLGFRPVCMEANSVSMSSSVASSVSTLEAELKGEDSEVGVEVISGGVGL